jgi:uncharacterized protein (TIGR03437 family)
MFSRRELVLQLLGMVAWSSRAQRLPATIPPPPVQKRSFSVPLVDDQGQVVTRFDASALYFVEDLGNGVTLEMALIPGGTFAMGSISNVPIPPINVTEQPVHQVSVRPFALGVFAVTRGQWRQVSTFPRVARALHQIPPGDQPLEVENRLPMDVVFYEEVDEFCQRLQAYTGRPYRLPSEAEWEYACRAGTTTKYHCGDGISRQVANYNDGIERPLALTPVGSKQTPNRFGLHDMHGNVAEYCADWTHHSYDGAPQDGSAWTYGSDSFYSGPSTRIVRGGMYLWNADSARSAARSPWGLPEAAGGGGYRLALDVSSGFLDPSIQGDGVTNAATGITGAVAPGEIVTLWGNNIGPKTPASLALDERGNVGTQLSGIRVLFDGVPAPLLYISTNQVNAVVPYTVVGQKSTQIIVDSQGQTSAPVSVSVVDSSPALFTADSSGQGQGAIANQDGSLNGANNPALRGTVVSIFATGEGQTDPPGVDGKLVGSLAPVPVLPVQVLIAGVVAEVQYAGGAPGEIAGLLQINARVPAAIPAGPQSLLVRIGQASSQAGVFIMVG